MTGNALVLSFITGFEKMDSGLTLNFKDRVSPISDHIQSLHQLGATPGPLHPTMNDITSDVVKVRLPYCIGTYSLLNFVKGLCTRLPNKTTGYSIRI